jgi:cytochrome b6
MSNVYDWFQERLEIQAIADDITSKYVPPHVNIFYCLGGITLTCFIVQVATGFAMTFYYTYRYRGVCIGRIYYD